MGCTDPGAEGVASKSSSISSSLSTTLSESRSKAMATLKKKKRKAKQKLIRFFKGEPDIEIQSSFTEASPKDTFSTDLMSTLDLQERVDGTSVAFGPQGQLFIAAEKNEFARLFTLQGTSYKMKWKKQLPDGLSGYCNCFITQTSIFARDLTTEPRSTFVFNLKFELKKKFTETLNEKLTCAADDFLLYEKLSDGESRELVMRSSEDDHLIGLVKRFHSSGSDVDSALFVSVDPVTGKIVITRSSDRDADWVVSVYTSKDKELYNRVLRFDPTRAILSPKFILVPHFSANYVSILTWSCDYFCILDWEDLRIEEADSIRRCSNMYDRGLVSMLVVTKDGNYKINVLKIDGLIDDTRYSWVSTASPANRSQLYMAQASSIIKVDDIEEDNL